MTLEEKVRAINPKLRKLLEEVSGHSSNGIHYEDVERLARIAQGIVERKGLIGTYVSEQVTRVVYGENLPTSEYIALREAQISYLQAEMNKARQPIAYGRPARDMILDAIKDNYSAQTELRNAQRTREKKVVITALASAYERGEYFGEAEPSDLEAAEAVIPVPKTYERNASAANKRRKQLVSAGIFRTTREAPIEKGEGEESKDNRPYTGFRIEPKSRTVYVRVQ